MAKYDHGGGCACGLKKECDCQSITERRIKPTTQWELKSNKQIKTIEIDRTVNVTIPKEHILEMIEEYIRNMEAGDGPVIDKNSIKFISYDGYEFNLEHIKCNT